ncbi:MAG: hypothetical protein ACO3DQ_01320 [Cephaloticoccus sp.]
MLRPFARKADPVLDRAARQNWKKISTEGRTRSRLKRDGGLGD